MRLGKSAHAACTTPSSFLFGRAVVVFTYIFLAVLRFTCCIFFSAISRACALLCVPQHRHPHAARRNRTRRDGATVVLETVEHVQGTEAAALAAGSGVGGDSDDDEEEESPSPSGRPRRARLRRCSPVVVGEEPLLVSRHDRGGVRPTFEAARRYTLRAVGPGVCTLLDLPRAAVHKYLNHKVSARAASRRLLLAVSRVPS